MIIIIFHSPLLIFGASVRPQVSREKKKLKEKRSQSFSKKCSVVTWVVTDN